MKVFFHFSDKVFFHFTLAYINTIPKIELYWLAIKYYCGSLLTKKIETEKQTIKCLINVPAFKWPRKSILKLFKGLLLSDIQRKDNSYFIKWFQRRARKNGSCWRTEKPNKKYSCLLLNCSRPLYCYFINTFRMLWFSSSLLNLNNYIHD